MNTTRTLPQRAAVRTLEALGNRLWGFRPNLMGDIVDQHGAGSAVRWFARNMPRYEATKKQWGPIRTHLVTSMISVLGGCEYCTSGHAEAFQLHYLERHDSLFPIDKSQIIALRHLERDEAMSHMNEALRSTPLADEVEVLVRLGELLDDPESAISDDDSRLVHLIEMFAVLNACGVTANTTPDAAHDPINKNRPLQSRYEKLRSAAVS